MQIEGIDIYCVHGYVHVSVCQCVRMLCMSIVASCVVYFMRPQHLDLWDPSGIETDAVLSVTSALELTRDEVSVCKYGVEV